MIREDYEAYKEDYKHHNVSSSAFVLIQDVYIRILETQLKAKENDLERQDMIIKCLSMDLDSKEKLFKDKDEEIERLKNKSDMAIEISKGAMTGAIISHNLAIAKARSIVAMLFWKAKKRKRFCTSRFKDDYKIAERLFLQAYAMLKDTKCKN